jgi:hypothetical protein
LRAELIFREVPGKLLQWWRQMERFRRRCLRRTLVQSPGDRIVRVPLSPAGLCLLPSGGLTLRFATGSLPVSHSRVRLEPPAAGSTWLLPDLRHRDDSSWVITRRSRQARLPGSFLESAGGLVLKSAEVRSALWRFTWARGGGEKCRASRPVSRLRGFSLVRSRAFHSILEWGPERREEQSRRQQGRARQGGCLTDLRFLG